MFNKGETLYVKDGRIVEFDHAVDSTAYVHPMQTIIMQSTSYHGDDFHEEEDEIAAPYLIHVPVEDLTRNKPLDAMDAEIASRIDQLALVNRKITETNTEHNRQIHSMERERQSGERDLERWKEEFRPFKVLAAFLDGKELFPLEVGPAQTRYHNPPYIIKMEKVYLASVIPSSKGVQWVLKSRKHWMSDSDEDPCEVFFTEEERNERVRELFANTCSEFRRKPNYMESSFSFSYGTLQKWVEHHPFLEIPEDIVEGKRADEESARAAQIEAARKKLEDLEGSTK